MNKATRTAVTLLALWLALTGRATTQTFGLVADYSAHSATVIEYVSDTVVGTIFLPISAGTVGDCSITPDGILGFVTDFLGQVG